MNEPCDEGNYWGCKNLVRSDQCCEDCPITAPAREGARISRATEVARALVARWEHGDEPHRQWLREIAIPDIIAALLEWR
jgi:hypothetical protein